MLTVDGGTRFLNHILDNLFLIVAYAIVFFMFGIILGITDSGSILETPASGIIIYGLLLLVYILFYALQEGLSGRTLGKLITGTKVVMENGDKLTFDAAFTRAACRLIPFEKFSFLGSDARGWHDTISKTRVIKDKDR